MQKNKKKIKPVSKPYLTGSAVDSTTVKSAVSFFFSLFLVVVANILLGGVSMWDAAWLNILFNGALVLVIVAVYYQNGSGKGAVAVTQGEVMYQRQEDGRNVDPKDRALCFHPLKGFVIGLLGTLPVMLCAVALAFVAQKQYTGLGTLPSWISTLQRQTEMGDALAVYAGTTTLGLEGTLRVLVRMFIMPWVNIVGSDNREGLLWLERFSFFLTLLPAAGYGLGYLQGTKIRTVVHTNIALGKRKRAHKEKKQRMARLSKGPEQLN